MNLPHVPAVYREGSSISSGVETDTAWAKVYDAGAFKCLIEPMSAYRRQTILGNVSGKAFDVTWGAESLQEGDQFRWNGMKLTFQLNTDDQYRPVEQTGIEPYQTGFLKQDVVSRG